MKKKTKNRLQQMSALLPLMTSICAIPSYAEPAPAPMTCPPSVPAQACPFTQARQSGQLGQRGQAMPVGQMRPQAQQPVPLDPVIRDNCQLHFAALADRSKASAIGGPACRQFNDALFSTIEKGAQACASAYDPTVRSVMNQSLQNSIKVQGLQCTYSEALSSPCDVSQGAVRDVFQVVNSMSTSDLDNSTNEYMGLMPKLHSASDGCSIDMTKVDRLVTDLSKELKNAQVTAVRYHAGPVPAQTLAQQTQVPGKTTMVQGRTELTPLDAQSAPTGSAGNATTGNATGGVVVGAGIATPEVPARPLGSPASADGSGSQTASGSSQNTGVSTVVDGQGLRVGGALGFTGSPASFTLGKSTQDSTSQPSTDSPSSASGASGSSITAGPAQNPGATPQGDPAIGFKLRPTGVLGSGTIQAANSDSGAGTDSSAGASPVTASSGSSTGSSSVTPSISGGSDGSLPPGLTVGGDLKDGGTGFVYVDPDKNGRNLVGKVVKDPQTGHDQIYAYPVSVEQAQAASKDPSMIGDVLNGAKTVAQTFGKSDQDALERGQSVFQSLMKPSSDPSSDHSSQRTARKVVRREAKPQPQAGSSTSGDSSSGAQAKASKKPEVKIAASKAHSPSNNRSTAKVDKNQKSSSESEKIDFGKVRYEAISKPPRGFFVRRTVEINGKVQIRDYKIADDAKKFNELSKNKAKLKAEFDKQDRDHKSYSPPLPSNGANGEQDEDEGNSSHSNLDPLYFE